MPTLLDVNILTTLVGILATLTALAFFDFYAFSPRPSGLAKRSRELAPILAIAISTIVAGLSLQLNSNIETNGLNLSGANDALSTLQGERLRLLSYPLVATNVFESLLLGFALLASAYFLVSRLGLLGWSVITLAITIFTGVAANIANSSGTNFGPFELITGLSFGSTLAFSRSKHSQRRRPWFEFSLLAALYVAAAAAGALTESPVRPELLLIAIFTGVTSTAILIQLSRIAGPHWEATSLSFVSGIGVFVIAGFAMALAPDVFNPEEWRRDVAESRIAIQSDLIQTLRPLEAGIPLTPEITPESETAFATRLGSGATRLRHLASRAETHTDLSSNDRHTLRELKAFETMLRILERLHLSRALIADVERRTSAAVFSATDGSKIDPMTEFWMKNWPWLQAEIVALKAIDPQLKAVTTFLTSIDQDLDRLIRTAVDLEIHRVDVWVDWAARQPRELLPTLKQTANLHLIRLNKVLGQGEITMRAKDRRFNSLQQNLRKMASVEESKWE